MYLWKVRLCASILSEFAKKYEIFLDGHQSPMKCGFPKKN